MSVAGGLFSLQNSIQQQIARQLTVRRDVIQDCGERPHAQRSVNRDGDVMLTTLVSGQSHMTACLPGYLVAKLSQCRDERYPFKSRGSLTPR